MKMESIVLEIWKRNLIKDQRTPFYHVPDFVKDFDDYLNSINKYVEKEKIQERKI